MVALLDMAIVGIPAIIIGVWQLVSVNREIARDKARQAADDTVTQDRGGR